MTLAGAGSINGLRGAGTDLMISGSFDEYGSEQAIRADETALHGVLVVVFGVGIFIAGESGTGKSECGLGLIAAGHSLVADDVVLVSRVGDHLVGRPPKRFAGLISVGGLGIFDVRRVFGDDSIKSSHQIDLVIELCTSFGDGELRADDIGPTELISKLPRVRLDVSGPRDLPLLIETAAKIFNGPGFDAEQDILTDHDARVGRIDAA